MWWGECEETMIDWKREEVVVTGGCGFIGSHLVDLLVGYGANVQVYDNLSRGHMENVQDTMETGSLKVEVVDLAEEQLDQIEGKIVFHTAARVTNIHMNRKDHLGMLQDNLRINTNLIESMQKYPPQLAVLCSTVCVYPHNVLIPTKEDWGWPLHPEETNEGYGLAKGILEKQGEFLWRELKVPVVVTRFSNACGPRDYFDRDSSHVIPGLIRRVMDGEDPLKVWGTGNQTRCFVDARDLALGLVKLAECPDAQDARPINIGHDREISMGDLGRMIVDECGKPDLKIGFDTKYPDGHARRAVDNTRLKSLVHWVPERPLEETVADMVTEYREGKSHL
jgi:nucleoside-diphosphate-sugar epimerase